MELGLRGKRALVTAASRGLGRAVAESLLVEDCRVCVTSSSEPSIEAAARDMAKAGGEVHALAADLGRDDECDRLFAWATSTLGGLDILVNNTVGPPTGGVLEVSDERWRESFDLIFMSALRLSRAAIPVMRDSGGGSIVNLAALTAKQPIMASRSPMHCDLRSSAWPRPCRERLPRKCVSTTSPPSTSSLTGSATSRSAFGAKATSQWTRPSGGWR